MSKKVTISKRLEVVASFLPKDANFADIGSDHAYLAAYVCQDNKEARAVAGEVNVGPLENAKQTIKEYNLQDQIEARLGNGLQILEPGEVNQLVIAGMGGSLITSILNENKSVSLEMDQLILQPNVDAKKLRKWLDKHHYILITETIVEEQGHIYEILVAERGNSEHSPYKQHLKEKQLYFGPYLLQDKNHAFMKKWSQEKDKLERIVQQMKQAKQINEEKMKQFEIELAWMQEVLNNEENNNQAR